MQYVQKKASHLLSDFRQTNLSSSVNMYDRIYATGRPRGIQRR